MTITLRDMKIGETGRIAKFNGVNGAYREKLLAMGLTLGATFKIVRVAPLGDPVEIKVRGFSLSLRKSDADAIKVERLPASVGASRS